MLLFLGIFRSVQVLGFHIMDSMSKLQFLLCTITLRVNHRSVGGANSFDSSRLNDVYIYEN